MIIGSKFSEKNQQYLKVVFQLSKQDTDYQIPVQDINQKLELDRTELKNVLEHLQDLGFIKIATIGGPLLYGHITITQKGIKKGSQL
ncbi:MAG: hypothetical protein U5J95_00895 [Balneolaceae bacterium]|nr:hypothetical protein [Balneolaceae bacterium]